MTFSGTSAKLKWLSQCTAMMQSSELIPRIQSVKPDLTQVRYLGVMPSQSLTESSPDVDDFTEISHKKRGYVTGPALMPRAFNTVRDYEIDFRKAKNDH
jgi:hypothetical protein